LEIRVIHIILSLTSHRLYVIILRNIERDEERMFASAFVTESPWLLKEGTKEAY